MIFVVLALIWINALYAIMGRWGWEVMGWSVFYSALPIAVLWEIGGWMDRWE